MLTPYAYLADGYLIFLRALRRCVRTNLQNTLGNEQDQQWWDDVIKTSLGNNGAKALSKNLEELYRAQEAEQKARDPFDILDPFHCERIIDKYHEAVFSKVFPNRNDIVGRLQVINATRNKAFAHPRSEAVSPEDVKAALDDMIAVLRRPPRGEYRIEITRLEALATAVQGFLIYETATFHDETRTVSMEGEPSSDVEGSDKAADSSSKSAGPAETADNARSTDDAPNTGTLNERELSVVGRAIRARRSGQATNAYTPLRYVWGELESKVPGRFPSEAVLHALLAQHPERFEMKSGSSARAILVREVSAGRRRGKRK